MRTRRKSASFFLPLFFLVIFAIFSFSKTKKRFQSTWNAVPYDELGCGCPRFGPPIANTDKNVSLCSDWSTARGRNQKVIAYTIYGNHSNESVMKQYYSQIEDRVKEAYFYYDGWIVRLYHNASKKDKFSNDLICKLFCQYPHFDPCQINDILIPDFWLDEPSSHSSESVKQIKWFQHEDFKKSVQFKILQLLTSLANLEEDDYGTLNENESATTTIPSEEEETVKSRKKRRRRFGRAKSFSKVLIGKLWRFLPLGDNYVAEFLIRDVDSFILPREVAAVSQWLNNSTALIHSMRDHPSHNGVILAGLWGGARWRDEEKMTNFLKKIISYPPKYFWNYDQIMLSRVIWPQVLDQVLVHDSYHCQNPFLKAGHRPLPFPTKRRGRIFVSWGPNRSPSEMRSIIPCPMECRPREHPDWEFC